MAWRALVDVRSAVAGGAKRPEVSCSSPDATACATARTDKALFHTGPLRILKKISALASRQTPFCRATDQNGVPSARIERRRTLYERSCSSMFRRSRRSKQKFRGRGVCGAHKLNPVPLEISCAPASPPRSCRCTAGDYLGLNVNRARGQAGSLKTRNSHHTPPLSVSMPTSTYPQLASRISRSPPPTVQSSFRSAGQSSQSSHGPQLARRRSTSPAPTTPSPLRSPRTVSSHTTVVT